MYDSIAKNNFKLIVLFQLFTALATSLVACTLATDMLLLCSDVDVAKFGVIKGNMYLVPAICFTLASGILPSLRKDLEICYWGYLIRCIAPFLLSMAVLAGVSPEGLVWWASISLLLSYTCATFANNMLVKVYRLTLLPGDFNRNCVFFMGLNGVICGLMLLLWLFFMNKYTNDRQAFVKCYIIIQFITLIFEYPAIKALRKVRFLEEPAIPAKRDSLWSGFMAAVKHREFLVVLLLVMLHGLFFGGLCAYVIVYLLRVWKLNPLLITIANTFFVFMAIVSVMKFRKFSERLNYPKFMFFSSLLMFVLALLWGFNLDSIWMNIIFLFLIFDGAGGIATFIITQIQSAVPVALAPKRICEVYIALGNLAKSIGATTGSWIAGMIFGLSSGSEYNKFSNVFLVITVFPALMILFSLLWIKMAKKKAPAAETAIQSN